MFKYLNIALFFLIVNCTFEPSKTRHGVSSLETKYNKLIVNKTNKNEILEFIGPPSSTSFFENDLWFYIERVNKKKNLFNLGNEKTIKNNILVIEINNQGILNNKELFNINKMNDLKFSKDITTNQIEKDIFINSFLSSIKQKINNTTQNKQ